MDTKKLQALLTVIKTGSLTAAAEELGYTQPGLTNMMNSIEDELGLALLVRSKTGVHLSVAGQELFPEIRKLLDASKRFEDSVKAVREKSFSTLQVGAYSSITRSWMPSIMLDFISSSPDVDLSASMQNIKTLYDAVKSEKLDCAIVSYNEDMMTGLHWTPLKDDEFVAVIPVDDYHGEARFPLVNLAGKTFLMPSGGFDMDIIPLFEAFSSPGTIRYTNMDDATIVSMVDLKLGITIMSELIMNGMTGRIKSLPLEPPAYRKLGIIVKDKRKDERAIKSFIASASKVVSSFE